MGVNGRHRERELVEVHYENSDGEEWSEWLPADDPLLVAMRAHCPICQEGAEHG